MTVPPLERTPAARASKGARRALQILSILGLAAPLAVAIFALTEPWAKARVVLVWGLSRSPGAMLLILLSLATLGPGGLLVAIRGRRPVTAAVVHVAIGVALLCVASGAYSMIQQSSVRALGVLPLASVRPARGLWLFGWAACSMIVFGAFELLLALRLQRSHRLRRSLAFLEGESRDDA